MEQNNFKEDLITHLFHHHPINLEEQKYLIEILKFVNAADTLYAGKNSPAHVAARAFILNKGLTKCLLCNKKHLEDGVQPGGHIEQEDKTLLDTALREAREETGLQNFTPYNEKVFTVCIDKKKALTRYDVWYLLICEEDKKPAGQVDNNTKWFSMQELKNLIKEQKINTGLRLAALHWENTLKERAKNAK